MIVENKNTKKRNSSHSFLIEEKKRKSWSVSLNRRNNKTQHIQQETRLFNKKSVYSQVKAKGSCVATIYFSKKK